MALSESQLASLKQASHEVLAEATTFLQELIRIDTTNPPGLNYRKIATLISDHLKGLNYETQLLAVDAAGAPVSPQSRSLDLCSRPLFRSRGFGSAR